LACFFGKIVRVWPKRRRKLFVGGLYSRPIVKQNGPETLSRRQVFPEYIYQTCKVKGRAATIVIEHWLEAGSLAQQGRYEQKMVAAFGVLGKFIGNPKFEKSRRVTQAKVEPRKSKIGDPIIRVIVGIAENAGILKVIIPNEQAKGQAFSVTYCPPNGEIHKGRLKSNVLNLAFGATLLLPEGAKEEFLVIPRLIALAEKDYHFFNIKPLKEPL
jgi:hypothetical protein